MKNNRYHYFNKTQGIISIIYLISSLVLLVLSFISFKSVHNNSFNISEFIEYITGYVIVLLITYVLIMIVLLKDNKQRNNSIDKIIYYVEEINNQNYLLDLNDNSEDKLSVLKNEIYKTMVMLKEQVYSQEQDKISLKNSLSDISHQIKTPLTSITIILDNILNNKDMTRDEIDLQIKNAYRKIKSINFLVVSLLTLSKFDSNTIIFNKKKHHVRDIIDEACFSVDSLRDLKNINININAQNKGSFICDLKWQVEAISNILKNAIEYSNDNSNIDISYDVTDKYVLIKIQDYGQGINKKDLKHIFDRFYKGKNSKSDSIGIGLSLAKTIVENSNGYITIKSKEKEGTIFEIKYLK